MKTLTEIYNDASIVDMNGQKSDKGTLHSYIDVYEKILGPYRDIAKHVLEVGVACGASLPLWQEYFHNSQIIAIDNGTDKSCSQESVFEFSKKFDRVNFMPNTDAYNLDTMMMLHKSTGETGFDVIIEDGSHVPIHQAFIIVEYGKILKHGGLMVIEDIVDISVVNYLGAMPVSFKAQFQVADLRQQKNRQDDIMLIIRKA